MYSALNDWHRKIDSCDVINVELYDHQKTIIQACLDIEAGRNSNNIDCSCAVIQAPFGSGKTFPIIALCMSKVNPKVLPSPVTIIDTHAKRLENQICGFVRHKKLSKSCVVLVGRSVFMQWKTTIEKFVPTARVLYLQNYYDLLQFEAAIEKNVNIINHYDIIICKNGSAIGTFNTITVNNTTPITVILNQLTRGFVFRRAFIDDFDTIDISPHAQMVPALFTYFVSATRKLACHNLTGKTTNELLREHMWPYIVSAETNKHAFDNLNVNCVPAYIDRCLSLPAYRVFKYVYEYPNDNFAKIFRSMDDEAANEVVELLNGDAVEGAADRLGIKTTSVRDIFEKLIGNKYRVFMQEKSIIRELEKFKHVFERLPTALEPKDAREASSDARDVVNKICDQKPVPAINHIVHSTPEALASLENALEKHNERFNRCKITIDRVESNLREGDCQVCCLPLEESSIFINKCCGISLCDECGHKSNKFTREKQSNGKSALVGKCPNCAARIGMLEDVLLISKDISIDDILEQSLADIEITSDEVPENLPPTKEEAVSHKRECLLKIIHGDEIHEQEIIDHQIQHLIMGKTYIECTRRRKVLVFANHNEILHGIEKFLTDQHIRWTRLMGKAKEIEHTVRTFETDENRVLLINSRTHCAGLNIQYATDLVFYHQILDNNIASQVAGRIHRIGRTDSARIHYVLYDNEQLA